MLHKSTTSGSKRAFQTLPRHLRRRAMSHNIKRLPVRLRMQAQNEVNRRPVNTQCPSALGSPCRAHVRVLVCRWMLRLPKAALRSRDIERTRGKCSSCLTVPPRRGFLISSSRRPGYLLRDYERRQKKNVWLETHIWHAKRFKMVNLWGYKIVRTSRPVYKVIVSDEAS